MLSLRVNLKWAYYIGSVFSFWPTIFICGYTSEQVNSLQVQTEILTNVVKYYAAAAQLHNDLYNHANDPSVNQKKHLQSSYEEVRWKRVKVKATPFSCPQQILQYIQDTHRHGQRGCCWRSHEC